MVMYHYVDALVPKPLYQNLHALPREKFIGQQGRVEEKGQKRKSSPVVIWAKKSLRPVVLGQKVLTPNLVLRVVVVIIGRPTTPWEMWSDRVI